MLAGTSLRYIIRLYIFKPFQNKPCFIHFVCRLVIVIFLRRTFDAETVAEQLCSKHIPLLRCQLCFCVLLQKTRLHENHQFIQNGRAILKIQNNRSNSFKMVISTFCIISKSIPKRTSDKHFAASAVGRILAWVIVPSER